MMSNQNSIVSSTTGATFPTPAADCKTRNAIYVATCRLCKKQYSGKTTTQIRTRICGHRCHVYDLLFDEESDTAALVEHLVLEHGFMMRYPGCDDNVDHNLLSPQLFNSSFYFTVVEISPSNLDDAERRWVDKLVCLRPFGINKEKPGGVSDSMSNMCRRSLRFLSQR